MEERMSMKFFIVLIGYYELVCKQIQMSDMRNFYDNLAKDIEYWYERWVSIEAVQRFGQQISFDFSFMTPITI